MGGVFGFRDRGELGIGNSRCGPNVDSILILAKGLITIDGVMLDIRCYAFGFCYLYAKRPWHSEPLLSSPY